MFNETSSAGAFPRRFLLSRQEVVLVIVTMLWGGTFLVVHNAMKHSGPLFFVALRYAVAGSLAFLIFRKKLRGLTRYELLAGIVIGLSLFFGYSLQTAGLQSIESTKSAFITALYVPIVPLLQLVVLRRAPRVLSWLGIFLAFIGLLLLSGSSAGVNSVADLFSFGHGELLTLMGAVGMACEIIFIGKFAGKVDAGRITMVQLLCASGLSWCAMPIVGESLPQFYWPLIISAVAMGVMSITIQFAMNWAQRTVSPTRATIIYSGEPIWAGIVGRIAGERLPGLAFVGAGLIVLGIITSELRPSYWFKKSKKSDVQR